jgi:hypothetical protein
MFINGKLAVAAMLILGAVSVAQAANDNQSRNRGGSDIGPLGQCFDPAACGRGYRTLSGRYGYAYVPGYRYRYHRQWRRER